ncbi:MAG: HEAT repeat domain-containing protein [Planctomycetota bacterium]|jgi:HEAT repeat protein
MRHLTLAAVLCTAALAVSDATAQDAALQAKLDNAGRQLIDAANEWRVGQGVPPVVWSEQIAVVLREQLTKAIAVGYEGGPAPREAGRAPQRAKKLHHMNMKMFDNYSTAGGPDDFDPKRMIQEQIDHPQIKQYPNKELNVGAAAVMQTPGGKWIALICLAKGDRELIEKVQKEIAKPQQDSFSADAAVRAAAVKALQETKNIEALPALRVALRHPDKATRAAAADALKAIRNRGIIPPLLRALKDPEQSVQAAALASLEDLTGREDIGLDAAKWETWWAAAFDTLIVPLDGSAAKDATPAEELAGAFTVDELCEMWNEAAKNKDTVRKQQVLDAILDHEEIKDKKLQAIAKKALGEGTTELRIAAIRCVARQKQKAAVSVLMAMVKKYEGKDSETVKYALLGLAQIGDTRALKVFTDVAWKGRGDWERFATRVFAVRYIRHPGSVDWLIGLMNMGKGRRGMRGGGRNGMGGYWDSLEFLTGESLGRDIDPWKDWWKKAKSRFRPEPLPDDYEVEGLFPKKRKTKEERKEEKRNKKNRNQ